MDLEAASAVVDLFRATSSAVYTFLEPGHPLFSFMAARSGELEKARSEPQSAPAEPLRPIGTDLKIARDGNAEWAPQRLVRQFMDSAGGAIWLWSRKKGTATVHHFPEDPYMPGLATWWQNPQDAEGRHLAELKVLRYVPTRRVTISAVVQEGGSSGERIIVKFKRPSKADHSAAMLAHVHAAAQAQDPRLRIARPLGDMPALAAFCQSFLEGAPFDAAITADNLDTMMQRAGATHARLHALRVTGIPAWKSAAYAETIRDDIAWIGFMRPDFSAALEAAWPTLRDALAEAKGAREVFCHGDFVPGQMLCTEDDTAITDFDMARTGLDLQEIAKWLASLKYHVPLIAHAVARSPAEGSALLARAAAAYLDAYQHETGRTISPKALRPFRIAAEIHYLAVWLKKDRVEEGAFRLALAGIGSP